MELPFEVVEFVVVDVVVFVCPSLLLVVVAVYPPVICVLLPEVFVWSLSSFVESPYTGTLTQSMKANINANNKLSLIMFLRVLVLCSYDAVNPTSGCVSAPPAIKFHKFPSDINNPTKLASIVSWSAFIPLNKAVPSVL